MNRRRSRKQKNQNIQQVLRPAAVRTRGTPEPPQVLNSLTITYRSRLVAQVNNAGMAIYPTSISGALPGSNAAWDQFRILHIEVWGPDASQLTGGSSPTIQLIVGNLSGTGAGAEGQTFSDLGTLGARRSHISVIPGSLYSLSWFTTTDSTTVLFGVASSTPTVFDEFIIDVTVEALSVAN
jgi:hypothetical protein